MGVPPPEVGVNRGTEASEAGEWDGGCANT